MGRPFLFHLEESRKQQLVIASQQAGLPMAELLRRMIDHCLTPEGMGMLVPYMSGRFSIAAKG